MGKYPFCFATVANSLIIGHTEMSQLNIGNMLFNGYIIPETKKDGDKKYDFDRKYKFISRDAISRYLSGEEAVGGDKYDRLIARSVDDLARSLEEIGIIDANTVVAAFHTFAIKEGNVGVPLDAREALQQVLKEKNPLKYIATAIILSLSFKSVPQLLVSKDDLMKLRFLTSTVRYGDVFSESGEVSLSSQRGLTPEEEALFFQAAKYAVTRVGLLWDDEEDDKFSLYSQESLLLGYPYLLTGYTDDDLATLEEAGLVRRPERFVLFDESDPEEDKPEEVLVNRQKNAIISVVSTMKPYEVEFAFEGCRLTRLGLEMLNSVSDDRGNESFMEIADRLNTLLSPEGFYRVRAHELKMSTQNADGDQLFTLGEELPLREVKSAPETEADDGMPF